MTVLATRPGKETKTLGSRVVRLKVGERMLVWDVPAERAQSIVEDLSVRSLIRRSSADLGLPLDSDGLSVVSEVPKAGPQQWLVDVSVEEILGVITERPLVDLRNSVPASAGADSQ